eukprot:gene12340-16450_t
MAAPALQGTDLEQIGSGEPVPDAPKGLIGPGTGLGVSSLVRSRRGDWVPIAGEGGHVSLSPTCSREADILRILWRSYPHVSAERAISGMGLENLYRAICELNGTEIEPLLAAQVTERALAAQDVACEEALERMCRLLGNAAANLAVTLGARGGIYIGGGVIGRLGDYFSRSGFRAAFEAKGRFESYMSRIPTYVIRAEQPALIGCAMGLDPDMRRLRYPSHIHLRALSINVGLFEYRPTSCIVFRRSAVEDPDMGRLIHHGHIHLRAAAINVGLFEYRPT